MASDIVPIQLSLTEGDLITLWAPRWREDGEEWEAFLGDEESLFAFSEVTQLAAFVRVASEHDLVDHPAWSVVPDLAVSELTPEDTHRYDIIGVPEIAAEEPDTWTIGELAEVVDILRSIADVCDLEVVVEVLDSAPAFGMLDQGTLPFVGREGMRLWTQLSDVISKRWDEVVDAVDGMIRTPEVDAAALAGAEKELAAEQAALAAADAESLDDDDDLDDLDPDAPDTDDETDDETAGAGATTEHVDPAGTAAGAAPVEVAEEPAGFWEEVGIDPIRITTDQGEYLTLRCYLDDKPVFLGSDGRIDVFDGGRALTRWIAGDGADGHALTAASTWPEIVERATGGELEVTVEEMNTYVMTGIAADLAQDDLDIDPTQLELASELLLDVGEWAGDDDPKRALNQAQPLGWLVSFVVRPDPTRLAPSPPFTAEATRFRELVDELDGRLREH